MRLLFVLLFVPGVALADWMTAPFTFKATHVDLVQLKKTSALVVTGQAVLEKSLYTGHLLVNRKAYKCLSVGYGKLSMTGLPQFICNMTPTIFMAMIHEQAKREPGYTQGFKVLDGFFRTFPHTAYTTIPVGFDAGVPNTISEYALRYLEPYNRTEEVTFEYSAAGVSNF
jgi:hypothetical protein